MIFDKESYYRHMKILDNITFIIYFICIIIFLFVGMYFWKLKGAFICLFIGVIVNFPLYIRNQIKVEEMQWKLDIYDMLKANSKNEKRNS